MPAILYGLPASGQKQLLSYSAQRDATGLVRLTETYSIRAADRETLSPVRDTLHSFYSTADTRYSTMAVEDVSFALQPGELGELSVTYVGLMGGERPPPLVRLLPGVVDAPIKVEIRFLAKANAGAALKFPVGSVAPASVAGYRLPAVFTGLKISDAIPAIGQVYVYPFHVEACDEEVRGLYSVVRVVFGQQVVEVDAPPVVTNSGGLRAQIGESLIQSGLDRSKLTNQAGGITGLG